MTNPRSHCSRPGTPTAGHPVDSCAISSAVASAASLAAATASSGAQQVRQMSDDFQADLVVEPSYLYNSSKVGISFYSIFPSLTVYISIQSVCLGERHTWNMGEMKNKDPHCLESSRLLFNFVRSCPTLLGVEQHPFTPFLFVAHLQMFAHPPIFVQPP